jgi:RND family efflux transporter MFP subunit
MNCRTKISAGLSAVSLLACVGCGVKEHAVAAPTVAVARAARADLSNTMTVQAELRPFQDVLIHAKVSGYVNPISVDIGSRVKAGDVIATLEVPELKDQLDAAKAAERRAQADYSIAHLQNERLIGVSKGQPTLVAQEDLDAARSKDAAADAALAGATAETDRIRTMDAYTRVTAPFDGVITRRFVDNGSLVEAGTSSNTEPIVELVESDRLRLRFPVPEAETPLVRDGTVVSVVVGALHRSFTAPIARNSWDIDRSTRTMVAEIDVANADGAYKPGMYASVTIPLESAAGALAVPLQAVGGGDSPSVLVVGTDGTLAERRVSVGVRTSSLVEIRSGLSEGDLVVVGDRSGLAPGEAVTTRILETQSD